MTRQAYGITICENGSYCCGDSAFADACCTLKQELFAGNESNSLTSLTLSSSIGASTSITSFSVLPSQTLVNSPSNSASFARSSSQKATLQMEGIAGGTVGGVGGVAALTLCALIWKRRQRRILQHNHQNEMLQRPVISDGENILQSSELYGDNGCREMDGTDLILELDPSRTWHEVM